MIENYQQQVNKICSILTTALSKYSILTPISSYNPKIIKSGISSFDKNKIYLDTSSVEGINNISNGDNITFSNRPSRANMEPIPNSVWFAKMKDSNKILIITNNDKDIIENNILSTGFLGIEARNELPISLLTAIIISNDFHIQRDLNSVGTTMAGINNDTFLKIQVPYLTKNEVEAFDLKYRNLVNELSLLRRKINILKKEKDILLNKYF